MRCGKGPHGSGTAFCEFFFFLGGGIAIRKQRCEAPRFSCSFFLLFFWFSPGFFCFWILTDYGKC